jgi:hypothetical protein
MKVDEEDDTSLEEKCAALEAERDRLLEENHNLEARLAQPVNSWPG